MTTPTPAVYIGLDVGKSDHHAVALTATGETVYDKALSNDETRLRAIRVDDEQIAELAMLAGADDDLAAQVTAASNRLRGLLTQIHPALERVLGPMITHPAVADLLGRYPTPVKLKTAGPGHVRARLRKHAPRLASSLTEEFFAALAQQTVVVAGTEAAATVVPILAEQLAGLIHQRARLATQVEAHPLHPVLISMPGVGVRTAARILTEVVGKDSANAGHLASYAGITPVTRRSGASIRGEHAPRGGNKRLKRTLYPSAFASLHHGPSRAYCDRKCAQGKRHNQALIALARRRTDVLYAMLRDGTLVPRPDYASDPVVSRSGGLTKTIEAPPLLHSVSSKYFGRPDGSAVNRQYRVTRSRQPLDTGWVLVSNQFAWKSVSARCPVSPFSWRPNGDVSRLATECEDFAPATATTLRCHADCPFTFLRVQEMRSTQFLPNGSAARMVTVGFRPQGPRLCS